MLTPEQYAQKFPNEAKFVLTKQNLEVATDEEFHALVYPVVKVGGGNGFVVTGEPHRESYTGQRFLTLVYCERT